MNKAPPLKLPCLVNKLMSIIKKIIICASQILNGLSQNIHNALNSPLNLSLSNPSYSLKFSQLPLLPFYKPSHTAPKKTST
jgi:hypothetical protein